MSDGGIAGKAEQLALRLGLLLEVISCDGDNESLDDLLGGDTPDAPDPGSPGDKVFAQMEQLWSNPCGTLQQATAGASKTITLDYYNGQAAQGSVAHTAARSNTDGAYNKHLVTCSLFIDYIFLDRDERRYLAQNPHQYLIEQVQFNDTGSFAGDASYKSYLVPAGSVNTNDQITITGHGFATRDGLTYIDSSGNAITGIGTNIEHYVIKVDDNTIKLAESPDNATSGIARDITNAGSGNHRFANITAVSASNGGENGYISIRNTFTIFKGRVGVI